MSNWSNVQREKLNALLGNVRTLFVGYNVFNMRTTEGVPFDELSDYDLILGYDAYHNIYVAWSAFAHQIIDSEAKEHSFSLHERRMKWENTDSPLMCFYQRIEGTKKQGYNALQYYEKIVLIKGTHIEQFCKDALLYLMPNREEMEYKENTVFQDVFSHKLLISTAQKEGMWYSNEERKRYTCSCARRDNSFRERVLSAYNHKCAICGESIVEVLQAAHIVAAADGGNDDTENGVCLCANHHLMYDSKLFSIDATRKSVCKVHDRIKNKVIEGAILSAV